MSERLAKSRKRRQIAKKVEWLHPCLAVFKDQVVGIIPCTTKMLCEINIPIMYMPEERYIQFASISHGETRVYITKGGAGGKSISINNVTRLATPIFYRLKDGRII